VELYYVTSQPAPLIEAINRKNINQI